MRRLILSTVIAVLAFSSASGQSVSVRNICSGKVLQRWDMRTVKGDMRSFVYHYNDQYQLVSVDLYVRGVKFGECTLEYAKGNHNGFDYDVYVKESQNAKGSEGEEITEAYFKLGENGFAERMSEQFDDIRNHTDYEYNSDNQLTLMNKTGDEVFCRTLSYSAGDITSIVYNYGEDDGCFTENYSYSASSREVKGNYYIGDIWEGLPEMCAYYGGILGKLPKRIPNEIRLVGSSGNIEFDDDGYIVRIKIDDTDPYSGSDYSEMFLYWTDLGDAKIDGEIFTLDENVTVYNLNGQKIYEGRYSDATIPSSQICLIRSNGKTKRVFNN